MSEKLIPPFANGQHNAHWMHATHAPEVVETAAGDHLAPDEAVLTNLAHLRQYVPIIASVDVTPLAQVSRAITWDELDVQAFNLFRQQLGPFDFRLEPMQPVDKVGYAAKAATGIAMAILEVSAHFIEPTEANKNAAGLAIAHETLPLLLEWMSFSDATDALLTRQLLRRKVGRTGIRSFYGMRFHPDRFELHDGGLRFSETFLQNVVDKRQRHSLKDDDPSDVIFGCPARRDFGKLYRVMSRKAAADGLFSLPYRK
ncbi:MAG: hypothetical protein JWN38_287 [Candidatus Saccharibacteria bacterium]|nr:hypothetical protein [Candidatus Saccharibacteria bacterium]